MSKPLLKVAISIAVVVVATGCKQQTVMPETPATDPVIVAIQQAVEQIQEDHSVLARVERGQRQVRPTPPKPANIPVMSEKITLRHWNGPADEAISVIAGLVGYTYEESGLRPPIRPTLILDVESKEFYDVLNTINDQSADRFSLRVDVGAKKLTVIYQEG